MKMEPASAPSRLDGLVPAGIQDLLIQWPFEQPEAVRIERRVPRLRGCERRRTRFAGRSLQALLLSDAATPALDDRGQRMRSFAACRRDFAEIYRLALRQHTVGQLLEFE